MNLTVYQPTITDLNNINDLILSAKRSWNYPEHLISLWAPSMRVSSDHLHKREFWVARNNSDELVYIYSISQQTTSSYELEDCWVAPDYIGKGFGNALFTHLRGILSARNVEKLLIVSDPKAEGFYQKMGAHTVGEQPSEPTGRMLPVLELYL